MDIDNDKCYKSAPTPPAQFISRPLLKDESSEYKLSSLTFSLGKPNAFDKQLCQDSLVPPEPQTRKQLKQENLSEVKLRKQAIEGWKTGKTTWHALNQAPAPF